MANKKYRTKKEIRDSYQVLQGLFSDNLKIDKVKKRIATGKYSVKDRFIEKLLEGDRETMIALFKKLFPDSLIADIQSRSDFEGIRLDK